VLQKKSVDEEATAGALDTFARNVDYPWPSAVEVKSGQVDDRGLGLDTKRLGA